MTVFLVPGLLKHLKRSVTEGVRLQEMGLKTLPAGPREYRGTRPIKLWPVKETLMGYWRKCVPGDFSSSTTGGGSCIRRRSPSPTPLRTSTSNSQASRVAEDFRGRDVDGRTWPYLIFLKNVREIR